MTETLGFGLNYGVPPVRAAWGARLIIDQDGHVDLVPDRQDAFGDQQAKDALFREMDARFPVAAMRDEIRGRLRAGAYASPPGSLNTRRAELVTLFDDGDLVMLANTNASAGYLYVRAFRRCDTYGADCPDEYRERRPGAIDPLPKYMSDDQYAQLMTNYD